MEQDLFHLETWEKPLSKQTYMITQEKLYTAQGEQEFFVSALYDNNKKMIEVQLEPVTQASQLGSIYIGRVENVVKNLNAAFIKIGPNQNCYLPLEDVKNPFFTKKPSKKLPFAAGDELLVQISREALKTKDPAVTTNLNFTGKYVVLTTGNHRIGISSKLSKDLKEHFKVLLEGYLKARPREKAGDVWKDEKLSTAEAIKAKQNYGVIVRTNAAEASDEVILEELQALEERYFKLTETAKHQTCYSLLYEEQASALKHVKDLSSEQLAEIITDDRTVFEELCGMHQIGKDSLMTSGSVSVQVNEVITKENVRLRYYNDEAVSLSTLYSVKANLENALKERVWLKSGAYLIIQPTEALTVIDVNTGKNTVSKAAQENFLRVNKEAAIEIARQLRLRNISGIVLVDFINLEKKEAEAELLSVFRAELKKDPIQTQLIDITKLGLVEVTRKKVKKSLGEVLNTR